jgi:hypothetical protein
MSPLRPESGIAVLFRKQVQLPFPGQPEGQASFDEVSFSINVDLQPELEREAPQEKATPGQVGAFGNQVVSP